MAVELKLSDLKVGGGGRGRVNLKIYPPSFSKLPELRVNSLLFNAVNESSLGLSYVCFVRPAVKPNGR